MSIFKELIYKKRIKAAGMLLCILIFSARAYAQTPDEVPAGASADVIESRIREEAEDKITQRLPEEVKVQEEIPATPVPPDTKFFAKEIEVEDEELNLAAQLAPLLEEYRGKELTFKQIEELNRRIEEAYRVQGYFVIAFAPPQKIKEGKIKLRVLVAHMGDLSVEGGKYFRKWRTKSYWQIKKGDVLRYNAIRNQVVSMNENPDRTVKPVLKAGKEQGKTDVILKVEDHFPIHAGYTFDNRGVKLTGKRRNGFTLRDNNLLGLDDVFLIGTTFGDRFGALFFQHLIPITPWGTRFIYGYSHAQVTPQKEFERFGINGLSDTYSLSLRQRLYRTNRFLAEAYFNVDFKEKQTHVLSVTTVWDRLRVFTPGYQIQYRDKTGGWNLKNEYAFGFSPHGDGNPLTSRGAESQFFKATISLERQQKLIANTHAVMKIETQLSSARLTPQEQYFLGGAATVRGYPESDFSGDSAILSNFEYWIPLSFIPENWKIPYDTRPLRDQWSLLGFVDYGYAHVNHHLETERSTRHLIGIGPGISAKYRDNLSAQVEVGFPVGNDPLTEGGDYQLHFRLSADI